jgi:dTDP-4-dehydrorhamnose 3,5-epimerase
MPHWINQPWQRNLSKSASGKPGKVHFAHGFMTLESDTEVLYLYKVDGAYDPSTDAGIAWDDPALGIDWPLPAGGPILSDKDRKAPRLAEIPPRFPQGSLSCAVF